MCDNQPSADCAILNVKYSYQDQVIHQGFWVYQSTCFIFLFYLPCLLKNAAVFYLNFINIYDKCFLEGNPHDYGNRDTLYMCVPQETLVVV